MSRIERGKANPSLDAIEILAGGLKVGVIRLFEE
jgi:transcriptional regulator with XRE-family HTH domain